MGQDPDRIREQIEQTRAQMTENPEADQIREDIKQSRARMGETVEAIGYKADVKSRVKESIAEKKDVVVGTIASGKDTLVGTADSLVTEVTGAIPDSHQVKHGAEKVGVSKENPLGLAIGGAAVGFLAGLLLPSTRVEDEKLGQVSDRVMDQVKETGQDALDRGKQVAQEAVESAKDTAKESGREQGKEVAGNVKETVREVAPVGGGPSRS
jgi:gas vesicle protein